MEVDTVELLDATSMDSESFLEYAAAPTVTKVFHPELMTVEVGNLTLTTTGRAGCHCKLKIDGEPVKATRVVVEVDIHGVPTATVTYLPTV